MTRKALSEETRKALEEFNRLLPEEQIKRLVASGTINAQGEVLGRFEPELTPEELGEIRRRLTSSEPRYTTDQVLQRLRSAESP